MRMTSRSRTLATLAATPLTFIALGAIASPAAPAAEIPGVAQRQRTEKKAFTDSEIVEGFLKPRSAPEFISPAASIASGKYDTAGAYSPTAIVPTARPSLRDRRRYRRQRFSTSTSPWPPHRRRQRAGQAGARRDLNRTIATFYGSERAKDDPLVVDPHACRVFARTRNRDRAFRRDPTVDQWRLRLLRLRL